LFDFIPADFFPLGNDILNFLIKIVKFLEELNLFGCLNELWITLMWKTEKFLSRMVRIILSLSDRILISEHSESIQGFSWLNTDNFWTVLFEVYTEFLDISDKRTNSFNE
jgi:hypothetical protein